MAPALLLLLGLIMAFARYAHTEGLVDQASRDAARAATAQNSKAKVEPTVQGVVRDTLAGSPASCRSSTRDDVTMTAGAFTLPDPTQPLQVQSVTVAVECRVDLSDLGPLPLPSVRVAQTFTSPLDVYRGYQ